MVVRLIVFNATFNNISVISWRSLLLVEETGVHGESHRPAACHWQTLLYIYNYHPCWSVTRRFVSQRKVRSPEGLYRIFLHQTPNNRIPAAFRQTPSNWIHVVLWQIPSDQLHVALWQTPSDWIHAVVFWWTPSVGISVAFRQTISDAMFVVCWIKGSNYNWKHVRITWEFP